MKKIIGVLFASLLLSQAASAADESLLTRAVVKLIKEQKELSASVSFLRGEIELLKRKRAVVKASPISSEIEGFVSEEPPLKIKAPVMPVLSKRSSVPSTKKKSCKGFLCGIFNNKKKTVSNKDNLSILEVSEDEI